MRLTLIWYFSFRVLMFPDRESPNPQVINEGTPVGLANCTCLIVASTINTVLHQVNE